MSTLSNCTKQREAFVFLPHSSLSFCAHLLPITFTCVGVEEQLPVYKSTNAFSDIESIELLHLTRNMPPRFGQVSPFKNVQANIAKVRNHHLVHIHTWHCTDVTCMHLEPCPSSHSIERAMAYRTTFIYNFYS